MSCSRALEPGPDLAVLKLSFAFSPLGITFLAMPSSRIVLSSENSSCAALGVGTQVVAGWEVLRQPCAF